MRRHPHLTSLLKGQLGNLTEASDTGKLPAGCRIFWSLKIFGADLPIETLSKKEAVTSLPATREVFSPRPSRAQWCKDVSAANGTEAGNVAV
ncbi:hypothetical protein AVEN_205500-1 [Araneus ventricosus]|uniref:Uncharacterized protein n=1 Tax=Araneus ventricosus TaxID=182803 RepID=A0A4Y2LBI0_ARAVE|nr:hypothetical protein AVEN_205500-1 [Araneus ventricosus]